MIYLFNRVKAALMKGVASQDPPETKNGSPEETVPRYCFFKKSGACGRKSATMRQQRRYCSLIKGY